MAMYSDDWNGACIRVVQETDGPIHSDLLAVILSSGGKDLFDICQNEQANRFIDRQEYQRAALCFLSMQRNGNIGGLRRAVQCLLDGNLPRDACALAITIAKDHELCLECYRALATFEEQRGAGGAAAKSHIAANKLKNAMRALVRKGQFGCYAAARCAFAISRKDLDVSRTLISEQNIETGGSFSSWYSTDDSYEQSIVLNALIDHSFARRLASTGNTTWKLVFFVSIRLVRKRASTKSIKSCAMKLITSWRRFAPANKSDEGWKSEKDLFPRRYPIVRRFWYVECFSTMVKMTLRCLTTEPTDSLSNGRDNEEYDNLVQYVRTFIETERARKVSSSLETLGEDTKNLESSFQTCFSVYLIIFFD